MEQRTQPPFQLRGQAWASCPMNKSWNCHTTLLWPQSLWPWLLSAAKHRWGLLPGASSFSLPHSPSPLSTANLFGDSPRCLSGEWSSSLSSPVVWVWVADPSRVSTVYQLHQLCLQSRVHAKWDFCQLHWLEQQWPKEKIIPLSSVGDKAKLKSPLLTETPVQKQ